ncbi:MAG TPA: hypothetical protein VES58_04210, partial [Syntrophobacteria bacterium]|nr:hypothetical protein [Syntrophobacteria bacterium]
MARLCGLADEITRSGVIANVEANFFRILLETRLPPVRGEPLIPYLVVHLPPFIYSDSGAG